MCPSCGWTRSALGEGTACSSCGHEWDAAEDVCPICGGSDYEETTQAAEVYDPEGLRCLDCGETWQQRLLVCPSCQSEHVEWTYPEIPDLEHDPLLSVVLAVESQIPRTEGGAILHREMVAWLRFHGVRHRAEMLTWEWFFREVGGIRARIVEEMTAPPPGNGGDEEREE